MLMPTRHIRDDDGDWNAWLPEWIACWESIIHSNAWDSMWLTLLSRLAKHDVHGMQQGHCFPVLPLVPSALQRHCLSVTDQSW